MNVNDLVRYKPEFQNCFQRHIKDMCGEIVAMGRLTAKVHWDDDHISSALISNLEIADKPLLASTYSPKYVEDLMLTRAVISVLAHDEITKAWSHGK